MRLATSYLVTTKNLDSIFNSIIGARAPERFTNKFLEDLGFKSSNDRLYIALLKDLGLLDESSAPTQKYFEFLDQTQTRTVLADCIKYAYEDLFNLKVDANTMTVEEVKNKLKTLTQGQKSDNVYDLMARTFKVLCEYADWSKKSSKPATNSETTPKDILNPSIAIESNLHSKASQSVQKDKAPELHYNIQIHLPETRDTAVYDAIFQSLKKHLF
ncbi:MAG: DUF5343 domain-containing protein [Ignavibacteriales bacterium]